LKIANSINFLLNLVILQMAIILNIETATDIGSVCVSKGKKILANKKGSSTFSHAKETTLMIEACLVEAGVTMPDLAAIAISSGPGSYTSLRIGTSIAKGMCYALDKPLIAVNTLESLALAASNVEQGTIYAPMIDARRMEVYTAFYDEKMTCTRPMQPLILDEKTFESAIKAQKTIVFAGNGAEKIKKVVDSPQFIFTNLLCAAVHLAPLALKAFAANQFESVAYFEPDYLKPPNITTPKKIL